MKLEIFKFKSVTSTNDIAINLIKNKNKNSGCVIANLQTKGRGTYGKKWVSKKGNLFSSIFFQLKENYPSYDEFSIINPVLISSIIKKYYSQINISLKLPNDLFVNKKKVCGILQELITLKSKKFLIIGVGLNISSSPVIQNKYEATNILAETKKNTDIKKIFSFLVSGYESFFDNLESYNYTYFKKKADLMKTT